jgi:hypothetical protein
MARQPTIVLNAALPKMVDTGSGVGSFGRIGGLAMAPNLTQCQAFHQRHRLSRSQGQALDKKCRRGGWTNGRGRSNRAFSLLDRVSYQSVGPRAGRRGLSVGGAHQGKRSRVREKRGK